MEVTTIRKKKGLKSTMLELNANEDSVFPRPKFTSIRTTISALRIEYPERQFEYEVIEGGIRVVCVK